jgi:muramoyltetrapeptide carboxypeptidase
VRLIRPAGAYDADALEAGMAVLADMGLHPELGPSAGFGPTPYYAGDLAARSADLTAALRSEAGSLWAVRGGSGTAQVLAATEPVLIRRLQQRPPWLVGFSDITALHGRLAHHGIMSVHGANVVNVADWTPAAQQELLAMVREKGPHKAAYPGTLLMAPPQGTPPAGPVLGGNLTVLASLCGTSLLPSWRDGVVLLEEIDERPYRLDRCLHQLMAAGAFAGVRAVVLGQLTRCDDPLGRYTAVDLLGPTLARLGVPVLAGVAVGHEPQSRAILLGAQATLDVAGAVLEVHG